MIDVDRVVDIKKAVEILKHDGVLLAPTDTVWALMCDYESKEALTAIFKLKKTKPRPVAVLCESLESIEKLQVRFTPVAQKIAGIFWPGPLTLVLNSSSKNVFHIAGANNSIGVRIPDSNELINLINLYGKPIAATSANISRQLPPKTYDDVPGFMKKQIAYTCKFDIIPSGKASTVVDCASDKLLLIRKGAVSFDRIMGIA